MGSKKARLARMKRDHPLCFFCAKGEMETEDHVPSRECFKNRIGPEGFAFPACQRCNSQSSQLEQAIAFYIMMGNYAEGGLVPEQFEKLGWGVANNNPELLPSVTIDARTARRHYRETGMTLPRGFTYAEAPIAQLPTANRAAFEVFGRRLTCALFYKEVGSPLPLDFRIATGWSQFIDPKSRDLEVTAKNLFPNLSMTNRRNTNIGDQFTYRWGYKEEGLFGFVAQFSKSFYFLGCAVAESIYIAGTGDPRQWKVHREDI